MKVSNPISRYDLNISNKGYVLEVGSGHDPMFRANVLVERYVESNCHRGGGLRIYSHQRFINADGMSMPFSDKEFDYVICNHVLEHVDNPIAFVKELQRVAKGGYIETPSFIGESLFPKKSHKWLCLEIDGKIVLYEKKKVPSFYPDFGTTFLNYLPYRSLTLRLFYMAYHQVETMRYEWKDNIDIIVNPDEEYYCRFFTTPWNREMTDVIFPPYSKVTDVKKTFFALCSLLRMMLKNRLFRKNPMSIEEYMEKKNL